MRSDYGAISQLTHGIGLSAREIPANLRLFANAELQGCVAFLPVGASIHLKANKPKSYLDSPTTLGEHLLRERTIRELHQDEAARLISVCAATYLNWEKDQRRPAAHHWPAVIQYLRCDPHPEPKTLGECMAAKRRAMGWSMREAAQTVGIDEGTWRRIEQGLQSPMARVRTAIGSEG